MVGKREMSEDVYGMGLQRLRNMVRADCPNPNDQRWNRTLVGSTSVLRRHCEPRVQLSLVVHLAQWAMPSEGIEGHEWGT
jgi:hypothetical protein